MAAVTREDIREIVETVIDGFRDNEFRPYCKRVDERLGAIDGRLAEGNGNVADLQKQVNGNTLLRARFEGATWMIKNQWLLIIGAIGGGAGLVALFDRWQG